MQTPSTIVGVSRHIPLDEIIERMDSFYGARGWSPILKANDFSMLRRIGVHPQDCTTADLERIVMRGMKQGTRANYVARLHSMWRTMNHLGLIDNQAADGIPKIRRPHGVPRPLTDREADILLTKTDEPMRAWFTLGCLAGLRAMEVANLNGVDLEEGDHGWQLRIHGKGGTDLTVPAHPAVVDAIRGQATLGRLWNLKPNKLSSYACEEMRRVGVDKKFHSCRHYFATTALRVSGGDLLVVRDLLRHASVATTQVYTKLTASRTSEVVGMMSMPRVA